MLIANEVVDEENVRIGSIVVMSGEDEFESSAEQ
jgi:hypothetical protein